MSKLETTNLVLKVRSLADADSLFKLYAPSISDRDIIVKMIFLGDAHWRKNGFGPWSIFLQSQLIGSIGLKRNLESQVFLDVEIASAFQNQGYAKEACQAVLKFGFGLHKLSEIHATVKTLNIPGQKLLNSLGFTQLETNNDSQHHSLKTPAKK